MSRLDVQCPGWQYLSTISVLFLLSYDDALRKARKKQPLKMTHIVEPILATCGRKDGLEDGSESNTYHSDASTWMKHFSVF